MPASNRENTRPDKLSPRSSGSIGKVRKSPRRASMFSAFFGLAFLIVFSFACAPPASQKGGGGDQNQPGSPSTAPPELTEELIRERINDTWVREVPEENGASDPISWGFDENEPKEIAVVEKKMEGTRAVIVLDIKTRSALNMRNPRALAGQIRTEWELKTGWVLRRWEIVGTENISMKYKNLPKPPAENANR